MSLAGSNVVGCEVGTMAEVGEACRWILQSEEAAGIGLIGIDSISEIADICLEEELELTKDGRQIYGNVLRRMRKLIKTFRDLPGKHIYMTARQARLQDDSGKIFYGPDMPGQKLGYMIPSWFDEVFCQRVFSKTENNKTTITRMIQTCSDGVYLAKDRSGKLDQFEAPDVGAIYSKILGE